MSDAATDSAVQIFAREFLRIGAWVWVWRTIGVAFKGDRWIRVIYYDVNDPFWGEKLINKVAENILSAIQNPEEAIFKSSEM